MTFLVLALAMALVAPRAAAQDNVWRCRVAIPDPHLGRVDVEVLIPNAAAGETRLAFPERLDGRLTRDNPAAWVTDLIADDGNNPLPVTRRSLREVVVNRTTPGDIRLRYRRTKCLGSESVFDVRADGASWIGAALFPTMVERTSPVSVEVSAPHGWTASASIPGEGAFRWMAPNGSVLDASRFHVGKFEEWRSEGKPWSLVVVADRPLAALGEPTLKFVTALVNQADRTLSPVPLTGISLHVLPDGPDRPETLVSGSSIDVRVKGRIDESTVRTQALAALARGLVRLRIPGKSAPEGWRTSTTPSDPATSLAWFTEGAADWIGTLIAIRAEVLPESGLSDFLAARLEADARNRSTSSAREQSELMFDRARRPSPSLTPDPAIRGSLLAASIDLALRRATEGARGLEDVMISLVTSTSSTTFNESKLLHALDGVDSRAVSAAWFSTFVHGSARLDLTEGLASVGFELDTTETGGRASLGVTVSGATMKSLTADSPLRLAGAREGDTLVGIGTSLLGDPNSESIEEILSRKRPGDIITVTWRRPDGTVAQKLVRTNAPLLRFRIGSSPEPSEDIRALKRKFIYAEPRR